MLHLDLSSFSALVFCNTVVLLLSSSCGGESQVIRPPQPIAAIAGDDIVLPWRLEPALDASDMTVEWTRPDLKPRFVHVWRDGVELEMKKHPSYRGRTSVFVDKLKHGDVSLNLSRVKLSDEGTYRCFVPAVSRHAFVKLVVGAVSSPVVTIQQSHSPDSSGVVLQCESEGWYPEPEVLWLDGEGNLLPAGPTETVRGPDDLYTVSSRVTVEKRHSNSFTCRVQRKNINQTRETHIHVPDDFFKIQSSSAVPVVFGLAVCIVFVFTAAFVWNRRPKNKPKMGHDGSKWDEEEKKNKTTSNDPEHHPLMENERNVKEAVKEEAAMNQDKGGQRDTFTLSSNKGNITPEIPFDNLQQTENGENYSKDSETSNAGNQNEVEMQKEQRSEEESRSVERKGKEKERIQSETQKETSEKRVQSVENEGKPPAESQQGQEAKKRNNDQSTLTFAYGHFTRY